MISYTEKVIFSSTLVIALAAAIFLSDHHTVSVFVAIVGMLNIIDLHGNRCRKCSSWKTYTDYSYEDHSEDPYISITIKIRTCKVCKNRDEISREAHQIG